MEREIATLILNARKAIHAAKTIARCLANTFTRMMTAVKGWLELMKLVVGLTREVKIQPTEIYEIYLN